MTRAWLRVLAAATLVLGTATPDRCLLDAAGARAADVERQTHSSEKGK